ncbi:MAG: PAS domain S-box protein [Cyanobium sp.]
MLRNSAVGMCLSDPVSGNFLSANAALCEFFERSDAELPACTWQQLTHPDDLAADQQLAARLRHDDFDQYRLRKRFLRADDSTIWGDLAVSCTRHADGSIRDLIGQISDVSELVEQAAYLQAARRGWR